MRSLGGLKDKFRGEGKAEKKLCQVRATFVRAQRTWQRVKIMMFCQVSELMLRRWINKANDDATIYDGWMVVEKTYKHHTMHLTCHLACYAILP